MAIAMAVVVTRHADHLAEAFTIVVLAGSIQILLGVLRLGSFVAYTPYSVVSGFMSGIGIVIVVMQGAPMLGAATAPGRALDTIRSWPWDTIDWRFLTRIRRIGRGYAVVMLITLVLTVLVDLVTAVALGFIAAAIARARDAERLDLDGVVSAPLLDQSFLPDGKGAGELDPYMARVGLVALRGRFSVASANALARVVGADIREHDVVIFDFSSTTHMDDSAALIMEQLIGIAAEDGTACIVMNLSDPVAGALQSLDVLRRVPKHHIVDSLDEARCAAKRVLDSRDRSHAPSRSEI